MADRTVRDFQVPFAVAAVADAWAAANHFGLKLVEPDGSRLYGRGEGILTGQMFCVVRQSGPNVRIEAWIHARLVARISAAFLIPTDMSVEPGGIKGSLPRKMCREAVNKLLAQLGQPPIEQSASSAAQTALAYPPGPAPVLQAPYPPAVPGYQTANGSPTVAARPDGISVLAVFEVIVALVGLYIARDLAYWSNWGFSYDNFREGIVDGAMALAYLATSITGFVVAWRLWSMQASAWWTTVVLNTTLLGLIVVGIILWGVETTDLIGIPVNLGVLWYLNQNQVRALFGRPPMNFTQNPG